MFRAIKVKNSFSGNFNIRFSPGLNVLSGKNGSGKSSILEYLSFALYGSVALRGSIKEYPEKFSVKVELYINGIPYTIERDTKTANLYQGEELIVKGTTPVTSKIKELLGYDYHTYSLLNLIKQHDLLSLTSSTPAQLLSLIEKVSGLEGSYRLENELKLKRRDIGIEESALRLSMDTANLNEVFLFDEDCDALIDTHEDPAEFLRVTAKTYISNLDEVKDRLHSAYIYRDTKEEYDKLNPPDTTEEECQRLLDTIKELKGSLAHSEAFLGAHKRPSALHPREYLEEQERLLVSYERYQKAQRVECPRCSHTFSLGFKEIPEKPMLTAKEINTQLAWLDIESEYLEAEDTVKRLQDELSLYDEESILKDLLTLREAKRLKEKLDTYEPVDVTELEDTKERLTREYEEFETFRAKFLEYLTKRAEYERKKQIRDNFGTLIQDIQEKKRVLKILLDVLKEVKAEVQSTVLPRINFVSSALLSQVTVQERKEVTITDDFRLLVDGLPVNTSEGSAQVLTNIVLRCALLSTFYSDNFLVSLQDEADAPLARDRFEALVEGYRQLVDKGFQIIVVSHKEYDYGKVIEL